MAAAIATEEASVPNTEVSHLGLEDVSRSLAASPVRLVAFDFDLTLTRVHAYNQRVTVEQVPSRWKEDIPFAAEVAALLRTITATGRSELLAGMDTTTGNSGRVIDLSKLGGM
mmetsp:Transcript_59732/g.135156  ORF Transcript_59732/g.135156 Transcript_59732/m.135156 type:complete len:113 (-) Transcript_59732:420-758(-)